MLTKLSLCLLVAALAPACGTGTEKDVARVDDAARSPSAAAVDSTPMAGVVRLDPLGCSGAKIGKRRILTAAHCVIDGVAAGDSLRISNGAFEATPARDAKSAFVVAAVHVHPTYEKPKEAFGHGSARAYDVAIVDVAADLPDTWETLDVYEGYVKEDAALVVAGYACNAGAHRKSREELVPVRMSDYLHRGPDDWTTNLVAYQYNVVLAGGAAEPCDEGAGGPVLVRAASGKWEIAAVVGGTRAPMALHARVGNIAGWIRAPRHDVVGDHQKGMFVSAQSNFCIEEASDVSGAPIRQYLCGAADDAWSGGLWTLHALEGGYFEIVNTASGKCLSAARDDGALALLDCSAASAALRAWRLEEEGGKLRIVNRASKKCVGIGAGADGSRTTLAAPLAQTACDGSAGQGWSFVR